MVLSWAQSEPPVYALYFVGKVPLINVLNFWECDCDVAHVLRCCDGLKCGSADADVVATLYR